jgi:hypothetical protein
MTSTETYDANAILMGGGKSFGFAAVGDKITGTITAFEAAPQTDIQTGEIKRWSDGNPMLQVIVTLATDLNEEPGDDGARRIYLKGSKPTTSLGAVKAAVRAAGATGLEIGGTLAVAYTGDGEPTQRGYTAPKQYAAKFTPPAPVTQAAVNDIFAD